MVTKACKIAVGAASAFIVGGAIAADRVEMVLVGFAVGAVVVLSIRSPLVALCVAVAAIPLEVIGRVQSGVEEITFAKVLLVSAVCAWFAGMVFGRRTVDPPQNGWLLAGFWAISLLGTAIGLYGMTRSGIASLIALAGQIAIVVMMVNLVENVRDLRAILASILVGSLVVCLVGFADVLSGTSFLGTVDYQYYAEGVTGLRRITATFYDPNALGRFLTFGILVNLTMFSVVERRYTLHRLALAALLLAQSVCLVYTFSRGAFIAVLGGLLVFALTGPGSWKSRLAGVAGGALMIGFAFTEQMDALFARFTLAGAGLGGRVMAIEGAVSAFLRSPVVGYGPGNAPQAIGMDRGVPLSPHNLYTEVLVSAGLLGAVLIGSYVFLLLRDGWRVRGAPLQLYSRGMFAALVGVLLMGLSLHTLKANELWLAVALLASIVSLDSRGLQGGVQHVCGPESSGLEQEDYVDRRRATGACASRRGFDDVRSSW
jgi:O-antigen ligase